MDGEGPPPNAVPAVQPATAAATIRPASRAASVLTGVIVGPPQVVPAVEEEHQQLAVGGREREPGGVQADDGGAGMATPPSLCTPSTTPCEGFVTRLTADEPPRCGTITSLAVGEFGPCRTLEAAGGGPWRRCRRRKAVQGDQMRHQIRQGPSPRCTLHRHGRRAGGRGTGERWVAPRERNVGTRSLRERMS